MTRPTAAQQLAAERRSNATTDPERPEGHGERPPNEQWPEPGRAQHPLHADREGPSAPAPQRLPAQRVIAEGEPIYDPLLTVDQLSDWLRVPKGTLYQWRSRRQGPCATKVGNAIRYRRSAVEAYLRANTDSRSA